MRPAEWPVASSLFGTFFLLAALQHLLKPPRNAFFLSTAGSINLPWIYIASAAFSVLASLAYTRWIAPLARVRQLIGSQIVVAGTLVVFWVLLRRPDIWIVSAFYIWIQIFGVLLVSQFFLLGSDLFHPRQARRIYGFIGAGGLAGGVAGAAAAGFLANEIGSANLLWLGVATLGGCVALTMRVFRVANFQLDVDHSRGGESVKGGLEVIRRIPHLQMIAALLFLSVLASTFVDWLYNVAVEAAHPDLEEQTEFIGQSFAIFNAIALGVQIFLTSPLLRHLGLGGALMVLPMGLGFGTMSLFILPGLWTASVARGADASLQYSIDQSAREILYLPLPTYIVQRAKPFLDIVVRRLADGLAGALLLVGGAAAFGVRGLSLITLGVVGLWILAALGASRTYRRAIERLLSVRDVDLESAVEATIESGSVQELLGELDPEVEAVRVHTALDLLSHLRREALRPRLLRLLEHSHASVRARAIDMLSDVAVPEDAELFRAHEEDPDSAVRGRAALVLVRLEGDGRLEGMREWLESNDERLVEAALTALLLYGNDEQRDLAAQAVSRLVRQLGDAGAPARTGVARALARLPGKHPLQRHLETLLSDAHPGVRTASIASAGAVTRRDLIDPLLPHLKPRETRTATRHALAAYGETGLPDFAAALRDPGLSDDVRRWIPGVFVEIGKRAPYRTLLEALPAIVTSKHRLYALKALNKLRRRHRRWDLDTDIIRSELDRELAAAYDIERRLVTLAAARQMGELPEPAGQSYADALDHLATTAIERSFRLSGLLYSPRTIYFAYSGLTAGSSLHAAHALELLETALKRDDAVRLLPLIDPDVTPERRVEIGRQWYPLVEQDLASDLEDDFESGEPWLQAYAASLAGSVFAERLGPELERLAASGPPLAREIARAALENGGEGDMPLSVVDKAAALRRTDLLGRLGADDLLQLAAVAEERHFERGEYLFYEGEEGDYLHVVLDGKIRAERRGAEVYLAGPGEAIGTFSILDREPRSASARAIEPSRTLAIHRADLAQILADNYSLVEGLFAYLTRIIRRMNEQPLASTGQPPRMPE